jgi:hypothetical protein
VDVDLNPDKVNELWQVLEKYADVFAHHKGESKCCVVSEHVINTQGFPPCHINLNKLSFWEEAKVNQQIQALIKLGKMRTNFLEYVYKVTLSVKKDGNKHL